MSPLGEATKPRHPQTSSQVERKNHTIKDATVKRFYYDRHEQLRTDLADFVAVDNFVRRSKTQRGLNPFAAICKAWADGPFRFIRNPHDQNPGTKDLVDHTMGTA